jgi:nicotinate-nucleotide adenylyltransferase
MIRTALFFGSFNPIHLGHLVVASYIADLPYVDEVWFVISPQNPFKTENELAPAEHRRKMAQLVVADDPRFSVCDIEFSLPSPSYTINTLRALKENEPNRSFSIICGSDILPDFHLWKEYESILRDAAFIVYPRYTEKKDPGIIGWSNHNIEHIQAPRIEISSTLVRARIQNNLSVRYMVPSEVVRYIEQERLYRK